MKKHVQVITIHPEDLHQRVELNPYFGNLDSHKVLSWVRCKPTWVQPYTYQTLRDHPHLSSSLILLKSLDWTTTIAIYPVTTFNVDHNLVVQHGQIYPNARRAVGHAEEKVWVVCIEATSRAEERDIVKIAVQTARNLLAGVNSTCKVPDVKLDFWSGMGVCTWEALSRNSNRPSKDVLLSLVPSFPIDTFLIDDGWQDTTIKSPCKRIDGTDYHVRREKVLRSFHPWAGFGGSLSEVVSAIKERGVKKVGVWMTLQGYWDGIDPDSELKEKYDCRPHTIAQRGQARDVDILEPDEVGLQVWLPHKDRARDFWMDWFTHLKGEGIGFVKVDNQAAYDAMIGLHAQEAQRALWSGMLEAVQVVWGDISRVIMCMSHSPLMLNGPGGLDVGRPEGCLVFRNSDDFDADDHPDFTRFNLYMTVLTSHLSLAPDFDMFATTPQDRWPLYHALLRALGPGPTLISDVSGSESDQTILDRLVAQDRKGARKVVKMDTPVFVPASRWFWDNIDGHGQGPALLGVVQAPKCQGGLVAAWNGRRMDGGDRAVDANGIAEVEDVFGRALEPDESYLIRSIGLSGEHRQCEVSSGWTGKLEFELQKGECELFVVSRVWEVRGVKVAVLGMMSKLAPLAGLSVQKDKSMVIIMPSLTEDMLVVDCEYVCEISIWVGPNAYELRFSDQTGATLGVQTESYEDEKIVKILSNTSQIIIS